MAPPMFMATICGWCTTIRAPSLYNAICYHTVWESAAMGESIIGHVTFLNNPADICTKAVSGGQKRIHLVGLLLHDLVD
jgi:hypothetical protein